MEAERGDEEEAERLLAEAERAWRAAGHVFNDTLVTSYRILASAARGRTEEAAAIAARSPPPADTSTFGPRLRHGLAAGLLGRLGRRDEARRHLAMWTPAAASPKAVARPLHALFVAAVEGRGAPPDPGLPSSVARMAWRSLSG